MLPVVRPCPFCSIPASRIWIESEHAVAFAADAAASEGHIVVVPKEHVPSIHALPMAAQKSVWALVSEVRGRLRSGLVPQDGFAIGFVDGLTAWESGATYRDPRRSAPHLRSGRAAGVQRVDPR